MTAQTAHQDDDPTGPRYRIGPDVSLTRSRARAGGAETVYLKHRGTGALMRIGPEELFLLTEIEGGTALPEIASRFARNFGKRARIETVGAFAAQMVEAGILVPDDPAAPGATPGKGAAPGAAAPPASGDVQDRGGAANDSDGRFTRGDRADVTIDEDLARYVFGDPDEEDADSPKRKGSAHDAAAAAAGILNAYRTLEGGPENGSPGPDPRDDGAAAPDGERARPDASRASAGRGAGGASERQPPPRDGAGGPANPDILSRRTRFARGGETSPGESRPPGMLRLFDPTRLLRILNVLFGWIRLRNWQLVPLMVFAALIVLSRLSQIGLSLEASFGRFSILAVVLLSLVTVNLHERLVSGMAILRHGGRVRHFGLIFVLFLLPRFAIDTRGAMLLDRAGQLDFHASQLRCRAAMFVTATFVWAVTRTQQTLVPDLAFVIGLLSLLGFVLAALPLLRGPGYAWLTVYLDQPLLRERALNHALGLYRSKVKDLPPPTGREKLAFVFYAVGAILLMAVTAVLLFIGATTAIGGRYGGAGLLALLALAALAFLWFLLLKRRFVPSTVAFVKEEIAHRAGEVSAGRMEASRALAPLTQSRALVPRATTLPARPGSGPLRPVYLAPRTRWDRLRPWVLRGAAAAGLAALTYAAFLPYAYEAGGDFTILPDQRTQVSTFVEGRLIEVHVREGSIVEAGEVLGRLDDVTSSYGVETVVAELARARATLDRLLEGATPEEIRVAEEQVALAQADLPFKEAQKDRADELFARGIISQQEHQTFQSAYVVALQELRTAEANLADVSASATDSEIRIAEAEVARLETELRYQQRLQSEATIVAPVAGRIVTENVHLMLGRHMAAGAPLFEIENHTVAQAEVAIAEADIGLVAPGDLVRLKAWADTTREYVGRVVSTAPVADEQQFGRTFRVKTELPNTDEFFRPGMTGFAKIDGAEMPAWRAFTRMIDRFFRIEVWGWIP